jgi:predicted TIM-barrel fold metal-dependent hydrolase
MVRLAQRHPDVTFVMAHMGRDLQAIQDGSIARLVARVPNIVLESSSTTTDGYGVFQQPAEILGPERIIYGSDAAPFHHPAINLIKVEMLDMPREWRQKILAESALAAYNLDPAKFGRAPSHERGVFKGARGTVSYPCPDPYITLSGSGRRAD